MENYGGDTSLVQMPLVGGGNLHSSGAPDCNSLQMDASATGQARALLHMSTVANQEPERMEQLAGIPAGLTAKVTGGLGDAGGL